jgi:uncharacterized protein Yka (UPF0111/DUF47 family)
MGPDDRIPKLQEENTLLQKRLELMRRTTKGAIDSFTRYLARINQIDEETRKAFKELKDAIDNI